jgi:CubicO group peptidase (beta-lactamase class C family)
MKIQVQPLPLLLLLTGGVLAAKNYHCPPIGPVLPAPTSPSSHQNVKNAIEAITETIKAYSSLLHSSAVSVGVTSIYEDKPLLDFHHTPENLDPRGVSKIDADSVYRIGSISKAYTTLAALKLKRVGMHDPVTKYVPELRKLNKQQSEKNAITTVDWDKVSLQALASHMGGMPADCEF